MPKFRYDEQHRLAGQSGPAGINVNNRGVFEILIDNIRYNYSSWELRAAIIAN